MISRHQREAQDEPMTAAAPDPAPAPKAERRRRRRRTVAMLPTMFTLANLLCGFFAIFFASRQEADLPWEWTPLMFAALLIFLGMAFDGLDGQVARLTRSTSALGEQLDSMADMVSFGVAPAFIAMQLAGVQTPFVSEMGDAYYDRVAVVFAAIYVACAALRLARFNIQVSTGELADHNSFIGLPSPGAAGTVASLVLVHQYFLVGHEATHWFARSLAVAIVPVVLIVALAMISRVRYVHVANRLLRGRAGFGYIARIVVLALLLLIQPLGALAAGFVAYALSGPVGWVWRKVTGRVA